MCYMLESVRTRQVVPLTRAALSMRFPSKGKEGTTGGAGLKRQRERHQASS